MVFLQRHAMTPLFRSPIKRMMNLLSEKRNVFIVFASIDADALKVWQFRSNPTT